MSPRIVHVCILLVSACGIVSEKNEDAFDFGLDNYDNLVDAVPRKQDTYEMSNEGFEYFNEGWDELNGNGENDTAVFNEILKIVKLYEVTTPSVSSSTLPPELSSTLTRPLHPSLQTIPIIITWRFKPPLVTVYSTPSSNPSSIRPTLMHQTYSTDNSGVSHGNTRSSTVTTVKSNTSKTITTTSKKAQKPVKTTITKITSTTKMRPTLRTNTTPAQTPVNRTRPAPRQKTTVPSEIAPTTQAPTTAVTPMRKQKSRGKSRSNKHARKPTPALTPETKITHIITPEPIVPAKIAPDELTPSTAVKSKRNKISTRKLGMKKSTRRPTTTDILETTRNPISTAKPTTQPPAVHTANTKPSFKRKSKLNKGMTKLPSIRLAHSATLPTTLSNSYQNTATMIPTVTASNFTAPTTRRNYIRALKRLTHATRTMRKIRPLIERKLKQNKHIRTVSSEQSKTSVSDLAAVVRDASSQSSLSEDLSSTKKLFRPRLTRKKVITMEDWVYPSSDELKTQFPLSFEH